ncbi:urate hydroxylase PuuD [Reyranella sp.]|uniref:urate hydroxylase PuuD n=1 Tax=Reyranella sp. TaxID=1929291 RepID=UPI0025F34717|nr:urate hydroxylase PuuD [Reyranella sp.]
MAVVGAVTGQWTKIDHAWATYAMVWLHVISGVLWIGLLWYLNFVQVPTMPSIPAENRSAITKHIAPNVLFYFRYAALATVITGLLVAWMQRYILEALMLQKGFILIGLGMWMALVMAFNVWFIIWPNQQKILGLVPATDEQKAAAAKPALYASRFNTMFSIGMLYFMVMQRFAPI